MTIKTKLEQLKSGKLSAVQNIQNFLKVIKAKNKDINAFLYVAEKEALEQAKDADDFMASGGVNPFLCGIPYAAKDLFCTQGIRTTAASKILDNYLC